MPKSSGRRPVDACAGGSHETPALRLRGAEAARTVVFFGLVYAYLWLRVQPALIYSCATITNFPAFYKGWPFFQANVSQPGGLVQYVSAFASHLFYYSWAGAAVITLQAWAVSACTGYLLRAAKLPGARLLRFVPAMLVVVAYARYSYHLPLFTGALASLAFACLYVRLTSTSSDSLGRPVVYLVLSVILYVVGAAAFLPFAILCATYELRCRRWSHMGLHLLVALALPCVIGVLAFRISLANAYTELLPVSWRIVGWPARERMVATVHAVYLFPILGALVGSVPVRAYLRITGREQTIMGRTKSKDNALRRHYERWALGSIVLFVVGGAAAVFALDTGQKVLLEVHHYACRRMWPEVLAAARRCPESPYAMNAIDRALHHTGRLGQDLCSYMQQPEDLLITGDDHVVLYWHAFDTLMDLGLANQAEKNLTECLEMFGEHPLILERLAKVNLVKGRIAAAKVYCGALKKTLFHSRWASECLTRLETDPNLTGDVEIQRLRTQYLRKDAIAEFYDREAMLTGLVEQGGGNRMAFEYLTAWYLLKGQLPKVVQQIERLGDFGYTEIPPLCQEAILIYVYGTRQPVDLQGWTINPETERRFKHFSSIVNQYGSNRAAAIPELARDYRGSYFFYYFCTQVANR